MKTRLLASGLAVMMLAGCTEPGGRPGRGVMQGGTPNKADVGTVLGGVGGAILGSNIGGGKGNVAAIAVGTLLGAALGNTLGASMDKADMMYYNQASQQALETAQPGQSLPWSNPQSGNSGVITPSNYYQTASGQYCREYTQTIRVGGQTKQGYGVACRQPDGSWQIQE